MAVRDKVKKAKENKAKREQPVRKVVKDGNGAQEVVVSKPKKKHKYFRRARMWIHYVLSSLQKDRGKIPDNIGDRIMITNNIYITRYYMSSVIHVQSMSLKTPVTLQSELVRYLRSEKCYAIVDITMKNLPYDVNLKDSGLRSRIALWEKSSTATDLSRREKEAIARCLYTVDVAKTHVPLFQTRIYITLRAKTGSELTLAEKKTYDFLNMIDAEFSQVTAKLKDTLSYSFMLSDQHDSSIKDVKAIITSEQTLSQMMPRCGSFNGEKGIYMGNNIQNGSQFNLDFKTITGGRGLYICAPSGCGKTVIAENMCCSAFEEGYAVCVWDIKGNEFNNFINSTGGYIVSLRQNDPGYINSWVMRKEDVSEQNAGAYFRDRMQFSIGQMVILSGVVDPKNKKDLTELLSEFHTAMYTSLGVLPDNRNTWNRTLTLNPFVVYDKLQEYMTTSIQKRYPDIARDLTESLKTYMSRSGAYSYVFTEEFDYADILRADTLMFAFGLLEGRTALTDPVLFRLKFSYMRKLNGEYTAYKFSKGKKIFKVLEESQVVTYDEDIIMGYVEEFTLRRAQGQTTLMLGNSVSALLENRLSTPILENVTGLLIGNIEKGTLPKIIERFNLQEYEDRLYEVVENERYSNSFLFINRLVRGSVAVPILKIILDGTKKYKLFEPVPAGVSYIE